MEISVQITVTVSVTIALAVGLLLAWSASKYGQTGGTIAACPCERIQDTSRKEVRLFLHFSVCLTFCVFLYPRLFVNMSMSDRLFVCPNSCLSFCMYVAIYMSGCYLLSHQNFASVFHIFIAYTQSLLSLSLSLSLCLSFSLSLTLRHPPSPVSLSVSLCLSFSAFLPLLSACLSAPPSLHCLSLSLYLSLPLLLSLPCL